MGMRNAVLICCFTHKVSPTFPRLPVLIPNPFMHELILIVTAGGENYRLHVLTAADVEFLLLLPALAGSTISSSLISLLTFPRY